MNKKRLIELKAIVMLPCYRYWPYDTGVPKGKASCITDGAGKPYDCNDPCERCSAQIELNNYESRTL